MQVTDEVEEGEIDGLLEQINIHGERLTFRVYPLAGPEFVTCDYDKGHTDEVRAALGKYVVVAGQVRYRKGIRYPYRVRASQIQVLDETAQPTLLEMRGIAPDATKGEETEEFLRRLRNGG